MRIVACQQANLLQGITFRPPLGIDLVAEEGAPYTATFNIFDDPAATNLRGLWTPWSVYEAGEVTYLTPEGPEAGDASIHTPTTFATWRALERTQHSEPGQTASELFWTPMLAEDLTGLTAYFVTPGNPVLTTQCSITGGDIQLELTPVQTAQVPSSLPYRLEVRAAGSVSYYAARGQIIFRTSDEPGSEPPLVAESGEPFEAAVTLWKDAAQTKRQSLVGWEPQLEIEGVKTLTPGHGITVTDEDEGELTLSMTEPEVAEYVPRSTRAILTIRREENLITMFNRQFLFLP